jgi:hypothetical protein
LKYAGSIVDELLMMMGPETGGKGFTVGAMVGIRLGVALGAADGSPVGLMVGDWLGVMVGDVDARREGAALPLGDDDGMGDG